MVKKQAIGEKEYTEKAGKAKIPEMAMVKDDWEPALEAFLKKDLDGGTHALFLDFDGTMARFTATPEETLAVYGFLSAVSKFVDKGYKVAIITGRPIQGEKGILAALERSGATEELLKKLDIFGSHGIQYRGSETHWEIQVSEDIAEKIMPYAELQNQLLHDLQQCIKSHETLKGLGISFEPKPLGATIHYRAVEEAKREDVKHELGELFSKFMPKTSDKKNFNLLENKTYKDFTYNSATESFEIRLNSGTTGVEVNKGTAVKSLAEKWEVKVAIAFGDDTTDLDMQTKLKDLLDDESSPLTTQAFVGVKHSRTPPQILTDSTIVVEGQESAVGLLNEMAERIWVCQN